MSVQAGPPPGVTGAFTRTEYPDNPLARRAPSPPEVAPRAATPPPGRGNGAWRLGNWRLRNKLIIVLLVPLLLAAILGFLRVSSAAQTAADLNDLVDRVTLGQQVSELTQQLQNERNRASEFVASDRRQFRAELDEQFAAVDALLGVVTNTPAEDFGPAASDVARNAQIRLGGLQNLRTAVTDTRYPAVSVIFTYNGMIDTLTALGRAVFTTPDVNLLRQTNDIVLVGDIKEQTQRQHASLLPILLQDDATTTEQGLARTAAAQLDATISEFNNSGLPAARELYAQVVSGEEIDDRIRIETSTLTALTLDGGVIDTPAADWDVAAQGTADKIRLVESQLQEQLRSDGVALAAAASAAAIRDGIIVALAVLIALVLLLLVARAMIRPLRVLRNSAFEIAQNRLPQAISRMQEPDASPDSVRIEPIAVTSTEEIGEVARAFDAVQAEAIRLAGEQALLRANVNDIFVNLSRRSQGLVKRQLGLIDKLEADEQDPDHLGDLFQLDHLATRMRRNNENLLVLAGAAELRPRRRRPVPADDVLRAAVSEVEDYQRIVVRRAPGISVAGPAVNDLVHLMAELLDNATNFSPPDSTVVLSSSLDAGGSLVIEITDSGVGIEPDMLGTINTELANPPTVDVAVSRRMGLFVVGRLAQRNEIGVRLQRAINGEGMVATVTVPAPLLMSPAEAAASEMATSEFPAAGRPASGGWPAPEPATSSRPAMPPVRQPARQPEQLFGGVGGGGHDQAEPAPLPQRQPSPVIPNPRREDDNRYGQDDGRFGQYDGAAARASSPPAPSMPPQMPQMPPPQSPQTPLPRRGDRQTPSGGQPFVPPSVQIPPARQDPFNDLFEAAAPRPEAEAPGPDEPIYDEVRTSWFRLNMTGSTGEHRAVGSDGASAQRPEQPSGNGNGNGHAANGNGGRGPGNGSPAGGWDNNPAGNGGGWDSRPVGRPAQPEARPAQPEGRSAQPEGRPGPARPAPRSAEVNPWTPPAEAEPPSAPVRPAARPAPTPMPSSAAAQPSTPTPTPPAPMPAPAPSSAASPAPIFAEAGEPDEPAKSEWGPIDNGWRAAREFTEFSREFLTDSGLPKRRVRSQPLPGAFAEPPSSGGPSARNPDAVRGRLREYQRGLRQGRVRPDESEPELADQPGTTRGPQ